MTDESSNPTSDSPDASDSSNVEEPLPPPIIGSGSVYRRHSERSTTDEEEAEGQEKTRKEEARRRPQRLKLKLWPWKKQPPGHR
jgi:hypothetical protein